MGVVWYDGSSSFVGKPLGGEVRGRLVMVDMVRMCNKEGTNDEIQEMRER